jgi:hypothetical protein
MRGLFSSRKVIVRRALALLAFLGISLFTLESGFAQVHGVPPSVTSIQFHVPPFLPNARPSVTSLGPYGAGYRAGPIPAPYGVYPIPRGYGHGRGMNRYGSGALVTPYYFAAYDPGYGYDSAAAGPYLQSGPPEQTLHIVVDLPPSRRATSEADDEIVAQPGAPPPQPVAEALPFESTVLVFRDGHQQQVTNYAIMGQTLYIFGVRTQKVGLGDLDIPATIKLNDDSGVEFHLPKPSPS